MTGLKVLAIAVASDRVGFVLLQGHKLKDWGMSEKATNSANDMVEFVQKQINDLQPNVLVTEKCGPTCKKGPRARNLIQAAAEISSHNAILDVSVVRPRQFPSKYEEAMHLAVRYPELNGFAPTKKRKSYDSEPRGMVLFEALVLGERVIQGPPDQLAAAMG